MAFFKYQQFLTLQTAGEDFDEIHEPGHLTPASGIYRCEGCGMSITSVQMNPLPGMSHRQHGQEHGQIRWRLVVKSYY
jgi:hypothetical protein